MSDSVPPAAELERLAVWLAEGAAQVARAGRADWVAGAADVDRKSTETDLVTAVDRQTEQWLVGEIALARPDDGVLGEEGGGRDGTSGVRWVLDPIDGTVNFVLGIPHYAVSVAAEVDGVVVAGAVRDIALHETFRAHRGGGAWLGTHRLAGTRGVPLAQAVIGTGFGYDRELRRRQAAAAAQLLPQVADLRRLGSAALALCYVAAGRLDGYFEAGLNEWDHAAGALVATEAGCVTAGVGDEPLSRRLVVAAGADVIAELRSLLSATGADAVGEQTVGEQAVGEQAVGEQAVD